MKSENWLCDDARNRETHGENVQVGKYSTVFKFSCKKRFHYPLLYENFWVNRPHNKKMFPVRNFSAVKEDAAFFFRHVLKLPEKEDQKVACTTVSEKAIGLLNKVIRN